MKALAVLVVGTLYSPFLMAGQAPKPGFGDKGCPEKDVFSGTTGISADDYVEVHRIHCFTNCPLYTVRIYGDGRVAWHGDKAVKSAGDGTTRVKAEQAQALIELARRSGFGELCDEYAMRGFDGLVSSSSLRIGGHQKTVSNAAPSNAPAWLYKLDEQIADLDAVRNLIGPKPDPAEHKR